MIEKYITKDVTGTLKLASSFAQTLVPGTVVGLTGELGTGKTVFTKGMAQALGVKEKVTSPTFTLINEYHGDVVLYHMDFYRLNSQQEILDIGVEEYFFSDCICVVEWAEKMGEMFPDSSIKVIIRYLNNNDREIEIERPE
ncbi:MAG TPA: tRNA (adenosine(37)-N6)-threonylcarbamoyltransferase complex ATPase subunit type 1 TsaE [bacterium]|nr:tRNA (adenosine(37)-N6)-threonylcarbamoyltransferase complex ATPase subunit type 1 TsaE [bacterium]